MNSIRIAALTLLIVMPLAGPLTWADTPAASQDSDRQCGGEPCAAVFRGLFGFFDREPHALDGNGRSCADCHMATDHFQLSPASAEARFQRLQRRREWNPRADDPLFRPVDADDFRTNGASAADFSNLRENGLIRIVFTLPPNMEAPPLLAWTPYGKHDPAPLAKIYPASGVHEDWLSDLTIFEAPDPVFWVGNGYAVVTIDIPGLWYAQSPATYLSVEEAEAFYDAVEWAGTQPWSNGKVGLSGVSYLTVMQWRVAELNPPHLAAINPWEGWSDPYREVVRHGGIPDTYFWPHIQVRWGASNQLVEDLWAESAEHPLFDEFWKSKAPDLKKIRVPAYVVASWSDHAGFDPQAPGRHVDTRGLQWRGRAARDLPQSRHARGSH